MIPLHRICDLRPVALLIGAVLIGASATALAAPIPVNNASFERPDVTGGPTWTNDLPDPDLVDDGPDWIGQNGPTDGNTFIEFIDGFNSEGAQHLGMQGNYYVFQNTGVPWQANTGYVLTVGVGNRGEPDGALTIIGLTNTPDAPGPDNTLPYVNANDALENDPLFLSGAVATVNSGANDALSFTDYTVSFVTGAEAPPGNIVIFLGDEGTADRSHFDNIRLDAVQGPSLIAHFPLDENGNSEDFGGFIASTVEGVAFGNPGANENTGGSARFDGASLIQHDWSADLNPESFTLALWAKSEGGAGAWNSPVTSRHDLNNEGATSQGYLIYDNEPGGVWTFWSGNGPDPGNWQVLDGPAVSLSEWEHITISYDDATETKKLYVNGELAVESNDSIFPNDTTPFNIGAGEDFGTGFHFVGDIDDIGLWNYALSDEEILTAMTQGVLATSGGGGGTVAYSQNFDGFDDGTTDLGDGSVMAGTANIVDGQLQLTENDVAGGFASFSIPAVADSSLGWTASFDLTIIDGEGANEPADGMSFNYGNAALGELGSAEEGMAGIASVTENISFEIDTWMNLDAEQGVNIAEKVDGVDTDLAFTNGPILLDGTTVSGNVIITYDPQLGASFSTTGLDTNADFDSVPTAFKGDDAYTFILSGRVGGANETKLIDNLVITINDAGGANPLDPDGDGIFTPLEEKHGLDPLVADADSDNDGDGVPASVEIFELGTLANKFDTDEDGYGDGVESNTGTYVDATNTGTDPTVADTDKDGILDGAERDSEGAPGTNPTLADTDGDGFNDGKELLAGTDPLDSGSSPGFPIPIGYWPFDDKGSEMTADLGPSEIESIVNGEPVWVAGHTGQPGDFAIKFDGVDDSVTTEVSLLNDLPNLTMSLWVRMEEEQLGNRIGLVGQNDAVEYGMINPTTMQWWSPAGAIDVPFGPIVEEWTHVAVVLDDEGFTVYANGEVIDSGGGGGPVSSGDPLRIGGDGVFDASGNFFLGEIDDVAIWDDALSEGQIQELADGTNTPLGPPTGKIPFQISTVTTNSATNEVMITWPSTEDESFGISWSQDLISFEELDDGIEGGDGSTSFVNTVPAGTLVRYYQVTKEE